MTAPLWLNTRRGLVTLPEDCTWVVEAWGALWEAQVELAIRVDFQDYDEIWQCYKKGLGGAVLDDTSLWQVWMTIGRLVQTWGALWEAQVALSEIRRTLEMAK